MKHKHLLFRIIFTSLFTLTALLCCRAILYLPKPIEVSFTVEAEQPIAVKLFWKNNATGKFSASLSKVLAMQSAKEDLTFIIPEREIHSLRIDPEDASGKVTISNITLHSGRTTERLQADRSLTAVNIGALTKAENRVSIVCDRHDPQLIYKTIFRSKHRNIDVTMGCIVLILSLCFSLYLSGVILKYRTRLSLPHTAWYNVVFCSVFFMMLALPVIKFNKEKISRQERRPFKTKPVLIERFSGFNTRYGTEFNDWLQDNSGFKEDLIHRKVKLTALLNNGCRENGAAVMYADQWAFYEPFYNCPPPNPDTEKRIAANLQLLQNFCDEQSIKLYVVVCPSKEVLYRERNRKAKTDPSVRFRSLAERLEKEHPNISVIHPIREMEAAKAANPTLPLHYLLDTHVNEDGARIIYDALCKRMQQDFPDLPPAPASHKLRSKWTTYRYVFERSKGKAAGYTGGDLNNILMLDKDEAKDTKYRHYETIGLTPTIKEGSETFSVISSNPEGKYSAYLLGDSSSQYLLFWAQLSFRNLCRYRVNNGHNKKFSMNRWESELKEQKPDVLIICVSEGTFHDHFLNLY